MMFRRFFLRRSDGDGWNEEAKESPIPHATDRHPESQ